MLTVRFDRLGVQPGIALDVVPQRCPYAQQGEGILVCADGAKGLEDLGAVRVELREAQGGPVDGGTAERGRLAFGRGKQNQHRPILPATKAGGGAGRLGRGWDSQTAARHASGSRNVRAPQGRVVGNAHSG